MPNISKKIYTKLNKELEKVVKIILDDIKKTYEVNEEILKDLYPTKK